MIICVWYGLKKHLITLFKYLKIAFRAFSHPSIEKKYFHIKCWLQDVSSPLSVCVCWTFQAFTKERLMPDSAHTSWRSNIKVTIFEQRGALNWTMFSPGVGQVKILTMKAYSRLYFVSELCWYFENPICSSAFYIVPLSFVETQHMNNFQSLSCWFVFTVT